MFMALRKVINLLSYGPLVAADLMPSLKFVTLSRFKIDLSTRFFVLDIKNINDERFTNFGPSF